MADDRTRTSIPEPAAGNRRVRRKLLLAGAVALASPRGVRAQAERSRRIGFVSPSVRGPRDAAFLARLRELGYVEGSNLHVESRFADGRSERLPALIDEVARANVELLVVGTMLGARAAKDAALSVPVVFAGASDPVAGGIVSNLARPEGNLTGTSLAISPESSAKWIELLRAAVPDASRIAVIWNSGNATAIRFVDGLRFAAGRTGVHLLVQHVSSPAEIERAFAAIVSGDAQGVVVTPDPYLASVADRVVRFANDRKLPAVYFDSAIVEAGGLMSYGPSFVDAYRRAAVYVDRILKGAKPGDLPVEQPTSYELVVNARTAHAIGLPLPSSLLVRADRVIR